MNTGILKGTLNNCQIRHEEGNCWSANFPELAKYSDNPYSLYRSSLQLFENGEKIGPAHSTYNSVRDIGKGRFFHWDNVVFFSTSDNSSPLTNGKLYTLNLDTNSKSYTKNINILDPETGLLEYPRSLHLELGNKCNLNCIICRPKNYSSNNEFMSKKTLDRIIETLFDHLINLRLDIDGEQFLYPHFEYLLEKAKDKNIDVFISSNGMLLNKRNREILLNSSTKSIQISLDSSDSKMLETLREGARLDKITKNISLLIEEREKKGNNLKINFHAALFRENMHSLKDIIVLAHDLGIDSVSYIHGYIRNHMDINMSVFWDREGFRQSIDDAREVSKKFGISINGPDENSDLICHDLFNSAVIAKDGSVRTCCMDDKFPLGNINETNFRDIWLGDNYQLLRRTYNSKNPASKKCKNCYIIKPWNLFTPEQFFEPEALARANAKMKPQ